jgi:hypothetical protein
MHSENFNNQKLSLKLFGELADKKTSQYARAHYDIILLFHRPDFSPKPTPKKPRSSNPLTPILKNPKVDL